MSIPTTVTFHGVDTSEALRAYIIDQTEWLEPYADEIRACRVVVEYGSRSHQQGNTFGIGIHLAMTGREIEVDHAKGDGRRREDPYAAVADSFSILRRRVQDYKQQRRGEVKSHV